jgi:hypothetical protein
MTGSPLRTRSCGDSRGRPRAGQPSRRTWRGLPHGTYRWCRMAISEESTGDTDAEPALRSLADKVNWLIDKARPVGHGSCSNAEVADLIERTTGERVSYTTIWKLRNGQTANP